MKLFWRVLSFGVLAFAVVVIAFAVAGIAWVAPSLRTSQVSSNLDPASFISACATLLSGGATLAVVWIINYVYIVKSSSHKADSDLLLDSLREVKTAMGVVHDASLPCMSGKKLTMAERARLIQAERDLSNSVHSFAGAIQYCETFVKPFDVTRLKRLRSQLKDRLTDDPFPGPYDAVAQNRATVAFRNMRDELTRLSFGIIHR